MMIRSSHCSKSFFSEFISEKDKRTLQNKMAYGVDIQDEPKQTKKDEVIIQPEHIDEFEESKYFVV